MLKHEPEEEATPTPVLPPGRRRVTPEELNAALAALESRRQEQARHSEQTVAIGDVVQELGLDVTEEEVWQQVQRQRAQTPAPPPPAETSLADAVNETLHAAAQHAHKIAGQASAAAQAAVAEAQASQAKRRRKRHGRGGMVVGLIGFACLLGAMFSAGHGLVVNGDNETATYTGYHKAAVVNGDGATITLRGDCGTLVVNGDHDTVKILGSVERVVVDGDGDAVTWAREPSAQGPSIVDNGDGNHIAPASAPANPLLPADLPPLPEPPVAPGAPTPTPPTRP